MRFEGIENIVERNPRRARLNCYPNLSAKSIQAVIEVVLQIEQQDSIAVHTRPNIRADLPKGVSTGLHGRFSERVWRHRVTLCEERACEWKISEVITSLNC